MIEENPPYVTVTHLGGKAWLVSLMVWFPREDGYLCSAVLRKCKDKLEAELKAREEASKRRIDVR